MTIIHQSISHITSLDCPEPSSGSSSQSQSQSPCNGQQGLLPSGSWGPNYSLLSSHSGFFAVPSLCHTLISSVLALVLSGELFSDYLIWNLPVFWTPYPSISVSSAHWPHPRDCIMGPMPLTVNSSRAGNWLMSSGPRTVLATWQKCNNYLLNL